MQTLADTTSQRSDTLHTASNVYQPRQHLLGVHTHRSFLVSISVRPRGRRIQANCNEASSPLFEDVKVPANAAVSGRLEFSISTALDRANKQLHQGSVGESSSAL